MDMQKLQKELSVVLMKYDIALAVVGIVGTDDQNNLVSWGRTFVPVPPRDHEEELLRDKASADVSDLAAKLTTTVYKGR